MIGSQKSLYDDFDMMEKLMEDPKVLMAYWIREREHIRLRKQSLHKPWSHDPIFQKTYFTNVHREDDKVTKFIRNWTVGLAQVEFWTMVARFINWPDTLECIDVDRGVVGIQDALEYQYSFGRKIWGSAYIVSTCGQKVDKRAYFVDLTREWRINLERGVYGLPEDHTCEAYHNWFLKMRGFSDFMAAQVVADLKHTPNHVLEMAPDFYTFAKPGPGSLRGLAWYYGLKKVSKKDFDHLIRRAHQELKLSTQFEMQDLQNCFCEFDKYMRILHGTGKSKRSYPGTA